MKLDGTKDFGPITSYLHHYLSSYHLMGIGFESVKSKPGYYCTRVNPGIGFLLAGMGVAHSPQVWTGFWPAGTQVPRTIRGTPYICAHGTPCHSS